MIWIQFVACVLIVLIAGSRVAKYGDILAEKTKLGGVWFGVIVISLVTSLPELITSTSTVTIIGEPDLALGNLLGANGFNMLNLALLDIVSRTPILAAASPTHRLTCWYSLGMVALVTGSILLEQRVFTFSLGWIGWYTPVIFLLYVFAVRKIYHAERNLPATTIELKHEEKSLKRMLVYFTIAGCFIIGAGIWLAYIGDQIAVQTGWGRNFVGSLFLAFTTTMPEITVSFSALRLGARDLAIANMIGSNLFNMSIVGINDIAFIKGSIMSAVSENHVIIALTVIILMALFLVSTVVKPRRFYRFSWFNIGAIAVFVIGYYFSFIAG